MRQVNNSDTRREKEYYGKQRTWIYRRSRKHRYDIDGLERKLAAAKELIKELMKLPHVYAEKHQHIREVLARAKALLDKQ